MRRRRGGVVALGTVVGVALLAAIGSRPGISVAQRVPPGATRAAGTVPPLPANAPTPPAARRGGPGAVRLGEEQHRSRAAVQAVSVPDATRGRPIEIRGRSVQLPPDAEVAEIVTHLFCAPGAAVSECPAAEAPLYKLVRGQSSAFVSVRSGRIYGEKVAPGAGRPFDFVREALR